MCPIFSSVQLNPPGSMCQWVSNSIRCLVRTTFWSVPLLRYLVWSVPLFGPYHFSGARVWSVPLFGPYHFWCILFGPYHFLVRTTFWARGVWSVPLFGPYHFLGARRLVRTTIGLVVLCLVRTSFFSSSSH